MRTDDVLVMSASGGAKRLNVTRADQAIPVRTPTTAPGGACYGVGVPAVRVAGVPTAFPAK